jgi:hypothetical protein
VSEGVSEPCTWITMGGRIFDVQSIAKRRRAVVSHSLKCEEAWLADRILVIGEQEPDSDQGQEHIKALENWVLPLCAACCGKARAHTLDKRCASLWKAGLLAIRMPSSAPVHIVPCYDPMVDYNECKETEYYRQQAAGLL